MSQPGRELLCKITELGFFSADFIFGHALLFLMCPVILIPYVDKVHSIMLFWLRPSRQIRPPIYTAKQTKLRRRRVIRFSVLYFFLLFVFLVVFVGPIAAKSVLLDIVVDLGNSLPENLALMALPSGMFNQSDEDYWRQHPEELKDGSENATQGKEAFAPRAGDKKTSTKSNSKSNSIRLF